eukprot:TRINITY_DN13855_c0_g1_i1.p1 TRINITY_DN13855_c0_g1~~TRINITY_DN13855_c0_g1_i1.p1  ORF type:complete len:883 (-),score=169.86 TRINITY_DN13855_c0_g1_i1:11-2659(-)
MLAMSALILVPIAAVLAKKGVEKLLAPCLLTSANPSIAPLSGGSTITVTGEGFISHRQLRVRLQTTASMGSSVIAILPAKFIDASTLSFQCPSLGHLRLPADGSDLIVHLSVSQNGYVYSNVINFTYVSHPELLMLEPSRICASQPTVVRIFGHGLRADRPGVFRIKCDTPDYVQSVVVSAQWDAQSHCAVIQTPPFQCPLHGELDAWVDVSVDGQLFTERRSRRITFYDRNPLIPLGVPELGADLWELRCDDWLCDVVFVCSDAVTAAAHKVVLHARASKFTQFMEDALRQDGTGAAVDVSDIKLITNATAGYPLRVLSHSPVSTLDSVPRRPSSVLAAGPADPLPVASSPPATPITVVVPSTPSTVASTPVVSSSSPAALPGPTAVNSSSAAAVETSTTAAVTVNSPDATVPTSALPSAAGTTAVTPSTAASVAPTTAVPTAATAPTTPSTTVPSRPTSSPSPGLRAALLSAPPLGTPPSAASLPLPLPPRAPSHPSIFSTIARVATAIGDFVSPSRPPPVLPVVRPASVRHAAQEVAAPAADTLSPTAVPVSAPSPSLPPPMLAPVVPPVPAAIASVIVPHDPLAKPTHIVLPCRRCVVLYVLRWIYTGQRSPGYISTQLELEEVRTLGRLWGIDVLATLTAEEMFDLDTDFAPDYRDIGTAMLADMRSPIAPDVAICIGTTDEVPKYVVANRAVLAARSPVFRTMFAPHAQWRESVTRIIVITQMRQAVADQLLRWIYSETCDVNADIALELLAAADRYLMPRLLYTVARFLAVNIERETCIHVLLAAVQFRIRPLISIAAHHVIACWPWLNAREQQDLLMLLQFHHDACAAVEAVGPSRLSIKRLIRKPPTIRRDPRTGQVVSTPGQVVEDGSCVLL